MLHCSRRPALLVAMPECLLVHRLLQTLTAHCCHVLLQLVPVYSVADSEDWKIRGYTKCPEYQQRLQAWLSSDEFKAKEAETAEFRNQIQQLAPQLNVSLTNWWNV